MNKIEVSYARKLSPRQLNFGKYEKYFKFDYVRKAHRHALYFYYLFSHSPEKNFLCITI